MSSKTTIILEDDLEGGPAQETIRFGLGPAEYEIDLNARNADWFRSLMAPFIDHARKPRQGQRVRPPRPTSVRQHSAEVRAWAKEQGIALKERGRIPASVTEQYENSRNRALLKRAA